MKKSLMMRVGLIALSSLAIVACGGNEGHPSESEAQPTEPPLSDVQGNTVKFFELKETDIGTETKAADAKLAGYTEENPLKIGLVTDSGTLNDHSFNESAWAGVNNFATENGGGTINSTSYCVETGKIHTKYVQPAENAYDTQGRLAAMKTVAQWGAKVIILPGFLFQPAIKKAIDDPAFKDVCLLALDCVKEDSDNGYAPYEYTDKVTSVIYREEQSGFLAGYAAVKEGFRTLGFCGGMAVPAVVRYGSGYCQGADAAAKELNLGDKAVKINYYYAGEFAPTAAATANCNTWYQSGTEVIFGCGGAVYQSVTAASQANDNKPWIGVDVNQHADTSLGASQESCITSAMKNLTNATKVLLAGWVNNDGAWNKTLAGNVVTVGAKSDNCVLPTPATTGDEGCWGFKNFKIAEYEALLADLKAGKVKVNSNSDDAKLKDHNFGCSNAIEVNYVD